MALPDSIMYIKSARSRLRAMSERVANENTGLIRLNDAHDGRLDSAPFRRAPRRGNARFLARLAKMIVVGEKRKRRERIVAPLPLSGALHRQEHRENPPPLRVRRR